MAKRRNAYKKSKLPYSFSYKIKRCFWGKECPLCKTKMRVYEGCRTRIPSIQHNKPISKGGEHHINNISVICLSCNVSIQDIETGELNNKEVKYAWDKLKKLGRKWVGVDIFVRG